MVSRTSGSHTPRVTQKTIEYGVISGIATVMVVINMLNYKKKMQEVATVRGSAVADMAPLFDFAGGPFISKDVMNILDRWRRPPLTPEAYM